MDKNGYVVASDIDATNNVETLNGTFPGWGSANSTNVATSVGRIVSASFNIAADSDSAASIQCQVEDETGTMETVHE